MPQKEQGMKQRIRNMFIWLLVFALAATLMGCTPTDPPEEALPSPTPASTAEPVMSAGERAAARLQQAESGLMADGLRMPLPLPPATE
jgi:predicted small lipoprotein YifL